TIAGAHRVAHCPRGLGVRSLREMMRQLGEMRLEIGRVELLERLAGAAVKHRAPRLRYAVVERLAEQSMAEARAAESARQIGKDAGRRRLGDHRNQFLLGNACDRREQREIEVATQDRSAFQNASSFVGEKGEAAADDLADLGGDLQGTRDET